LTKKRIVVQLIREEEQMTPTVIEYRGDPKRYVSVILGAIDRGRLTYNGDANCEQTFRSLSSVIDVISPKNGKALSIETLVVMVSNEEERLTQRAGEFSDYSEGKFE
jgi:hypothetical protein